MNWLNRHYAFALAVVIAAAFVIRIGATAEFQGLAAPPKAEANPDQVEYELFAWHLSQGEGYCLEKGRPSACRPPGTAFALAPIYAVFGHSYVAARIWWCALSALTCLAAAWLGSLAISRNAGLLAAAWLAVYPGHFYYSMHFLSEVPFALSVALACGWSIQACRRDAIAYDVLAGLAWGMAILIRPNIAIAAGLALAVRMIGSPSWRTRLRQSVPQALCMALAVLPWMARNASVVGRPTVCTVVGGFTFWGAHNAQTANDPKARGYWIPCHTLVDSDHPLPPDEAEKGDAAWNYGLEFVRRHPQDMPLLAAMKVARLIVPFDETENRTVFLAFAASWLLSLPFVVVGMVKLARHGRRAARVLFMPLVATLLTAMIFYGCSRFRDGLAPILAVFVAAGVSRFTPRSQSE